ncbi:Type IV secretion system protein (plasmid) [Phaeobacter piscinae]|uniref:Type IV secretion system protein n=1 Tax=Phaeobacter piscinae TaxID=1580596 RepID=A0ABM6PJU7_9RHOB|nr:MULTISPECIES: type IV secretion system protein [Phaeobacter]ATG38087.1 Type IV secretion system protein [Phaeobacter piscinae]AUQ88608.1 Type IV secretion system protein [Phaeobacter piscinae]AUQ92597.1 Type IV secretion system protein [Phaeobacter inhibens]AUR26413.1 Type IV secretion system protein [Phaeobacter piscinae]
MKFLINVSRTALFSGVLAFSGLSGSQVTAQGVPTIDGTQVANLIQQLNHMTEDLQVQFDQLNTMRTQLETQISQLTNLESQLLSLVEGNGLGQLLATVEDFQRLRGAIEQPLESLDQIRNGNFTGAFRSGSAAASRLRGVLNGAGFTETRLSTLASSEKPQEQNLATQAGASAMLSVAAEESHEEAGESLDRLQTMVGHIDDQDGLKAAVDLNTRVTAELGIILTQIWRLEAAAGVSAGQLGVVDAATLAAEREFRTMEVPE